MTFCMHKNSADDFSSTLKIIEPLLWKKRGAEALFFYERDEAFFATLSGHVIMKGEDAQ